MAQKQTKTKEVVEEVDTKEKVEDTAKQPKKKKRAKNLCQHQRKKNRIDLALKNVPPHLSLATATTTATLDSIERTNGSRIAER